MIKCFLTTYRICLSTAVNRWIYYLRKIPIIKETVPASLYHKTGLKDGLSVFMIIIAALMELFKKSVYVVILFGLVIWAVPDSELRLAALLQLFLFSSVIVGSMNQFKMFQTDNMRFMFLKIMRIDSSLYIKTQVYSEYLIYVIGMLPGMTIAVVLLHGSPLLAPALLSLALGAHTAMDYLQMKLFRKKRTLPFIKHAFKIILASFVVFIIGILLLKTGIIMRQLVTLCYVGYLCLFIIIAVFVSINRYPYFSEASQVSILYYKQMTAAATNTEEPVSFHDVAIRNKDIAQMTKNRNAYMNRHGYAYLNAIFFHRQKRIFFRPVRNWLLALTVVAFVILVIGKSVGADVIESITVNALLPGLIFVMYIMNIGTRATRSLFYNCDASLLQYSFYRRREAVLKNFTIRLRYLVIYNFIPAVVLCIYLAFGFRFFHITISALDMIIYSLTILLLSVLFSLHYLFLYYIFQPYTKDYKVKNPFYAILNSVMYVLCLIPMYTHVKSVYFIWYVLLFTIVYMLIALICVYRYAPKTFRIK